MVRRRPGPRFAALVLCLAAGLSGGPACRAQVMPVVVVDWPASLFGQLDSRPLPSTMVFGFTGVDPDGSQVNPESFRFLFKRAYLPDLDIYVASRYQFDQHMDELMSFADSAWSGWQPYPADPAQRRITFPGQPRLDQQDRLIHYLFAVQVMDPAGAVSLDRTYGMNVVNTHVNPNLTPILTVHEPNLGVETFSGLNGVVQYDIPEGMPVEFSWIGSTAYGLEVTAYRYGWDLSDPDDEFDPGWAVPPGNTPDHRQAPAAVFSSGIHTLTIQCWDELDQLTRAQYVLSVILIPDLPYRLPVLLMDDVRDRDSNGWVGPDLITPLDNDQYRDAFWEEVLTGSGGVAGFVPARDVLDTEGDLLSFRDLVHYQAVIWTTRYAQGNFIWDHFKPDPGHPLGFNWLGHFQAFAGNLFMCGPRAMNSFVEDEGRNWWLPILFDTGEETMLCDGDLYDAGFGTYPAPDGTDIPLGPERFPYRNAGVATIDHVTPRYAVYGTCGFGSTSNQARDSACAGMKGLILDEDFKAAHMPEGGAFPDTIFTDPGIDWKDLDAGWRDNLRAWIWGSDELYDGNITDRTTPWSPQDCDGQPCVEPMFRLYSRFDWVDDLHAAAGDTAWPSPLIEPGDDLLDHCGQHAFTPGWQTRTTDQVVGLVTRKNLETKPTGTGDVLWGFDPYRFRRDEAKSAIRWVLESHFGFFMYPGR